MWLVEWSSWVRCGCFTKNDGVGVSRRCLLCTESVLLFVYLRGDVLSSVRLVQGMCCHQVIISTTVIVFQVIIIPDHLVDVILTSQSV